MKVTAIITGGGQGNRMRSPVNKQFLERNKKPIFAHTLLKFQQCASVDQIVVVVPANWIERVSTEIVKGYEISKVSEIVHGGATRTESVLKGLQKLDSNTSIVAIHDAVRPLVRVDDIKKVIAAGEKFGAAILAVKAQDTVKLVENGIVKSTPDRKLLWQVQTPQVFEKELIIKAYQKAVDEKIIGTDDSSLVEHLGGKVHIVEGSYSNIKITNPGDLEMAEFLLSQTSED